MYAIYGQSKHILVLVMTLGLVNPIVNSVRRHARFAAVPNHETSAVLRQHACPRGDAPSVQRMRPAE